MDLYLPLTWSQKTIPVILQLKMPLHILGNNGKLTGDLQNNRQTRQYEDPSTLRGMVRRWVSLL